MTFLKELVPVCRTKILAGFGQLISDKYLYLHPISIKTKNRHTVF
jgi:hypothetical protein